MLQKTTELNHSTREINFKNYDTINTNDNYSQLEIYTLLIIENQIFKKTC